MIIEELTLHDFGIYRGRNVVELSPVNPERPIVLIGAKNGRGKTTLLDSINVVLFGSRARLSNRGSLSWEEYLRRSVHRNATGGAAVGMRFTVADDFEIRTYEINRSWVPTPRGVRESFEVVVNGRPDRVLAEDWNEHIEGLLPLDVASLNFFDGEKIDDLADPGQSKNVIAAAIRGLLGLGVIERLEADLKVYLRRKQDEIIGDSASDELVGVEAELRSLMDRKSAVIIEQAQAKSTLDQMLDAMARTEQQAAQLGADKWERRAELEQRRRDLSELRAGLEQRLQALAAGPAPLGLVADLIRRALLQTERDLKVGHAQLLLQLLEQRDQWTLAQVESSIAGVLEPILTGDRQDRGTQAAGMIVHSAHTTVMPLLHHAHDEAMARQESSAAIEELDNVDSAITDVERLMMAVPTEAQLLPVLTELAALRAQVESAQTYYQSLVDESHHLTSAIERLDLRVGRMREAEADRQKEALEERRAREYAARALATVGSVAGLTVTRNLTLIENAILRRFGELIGKSGLVTGVRIDRDTLELRVTTGDREELPIDRMSAGERQLLATATLWGLSTVAGRSIPLVVDTPLGRLDETHRVHLALNYFPAASHQVIILSTDSEFDADLRGLIQHAVSREYLIEFSDADESSTIRPGYFVEVAGGR